MGLPVPELVWIQEVGQDAFESNTRRVHGIAPISEYTDTPVYIALQTFRLVLVSCTMFFIHTSTSLKYSNTYANKLFVECAHQPLPSQLHTPHVLPSLILSTPHSH